MNASKLLELSRLPSDRPVPEVDQRAAAGHSALEIMHKVRNPLETLVNLNYLILHSADDPDQVRSYRPVRSELFIARC